MTRILRKYHRGEDAQCVVSTVPCYMVARQLAKQGFYNEAVTLLEESLSILPRYPLYLKALGEMQLVAGHSQQAVESLELALSLEPRNQRIRRLLEERAAHLQQK